MAANEFAAWQFGHSAGCGVAKPQWWQTSWRRKRWSTSQASQFGQEKRKPQARHRGQRCIAPAIEEEQRLFTALDRDLHLAGQRRRDETPGRRALATQIDGFDRRHTLAAETLRQREPPVAAAPGVNFRFKRGRRRRQHHRDARNVAAHHGHIAGVVAHAVLLFVGGVMLLIDDNEAEIGVGQKQRRARANHDGNFTIGNRAPGPRPPARRQLRMPFRRADAKAGRKSVKKLRRQRNFRHQDQRLPAVADRIGNRLEIDLSLARAGDAVEERDRVAAFGNCGSQFRRGGTLVVGEIGLREIRVGFFGDRLRWQNQTLQRTLVDQAVDHSSADAGLAGRFAFAAQHSVCQKRQDPLARRGHPLRVRTRKADANALALGPEMLAHAQAHPQHHAARGDGVVRDPIDETAQLGAQRRQFELFLDVLEPVVEPGIGLRVFRPDHRGRLAGAERHADDIARREFKRFRHPV